MKNTLKALILILILALSITFLISCNKDEDKGKGIIIPEFSINIIDGEETITVTNEDIKTLDLVNYAKTKNGETTYYRGFNLAAVIDAMDIDDEGITSIHIAEYVNGEEEYGKNLEAENLSTGILAVFYTDTADGDFSPIGVEKGPIRAFSNADETEFTDVQRANTIIINR